MISQARGQVLAELAADLRGLSDLTHVAPRVQSSSLIRPARIWASLIRASADSSRITISDLLISRLKITLAIPCLIEQERITSSARVDSHCAATAFAVDATAHAVFVDCLAVQRHTAILHARL